MNILREKKTYLLWKVCCLLGLSSLGCPKGCLKTFTILNINIRHSINTKCKYKVQLFSVTFLEHKKCLFDFKFAIYLLLRFLSFMRPLALKYVKNCASEVHLKVCDNLEKAGKWDLLWYEFASEERFCQSFSGLFKEF